MKNKNDHCYKEPELSVGKVDSPWGANMERSTMKDAFIINLLFPPGSYIHPRLWLIASSTSLGLSLWLTQHVSSSWIMLLQLYNTEFLKHMSVCIHKFQAEKRGVLHHKLSEISVWYLNQ